MQRRELFQGIAATVAASGVGLTKASVVEATDLKPALAVLEFAGPLSVDMAERLRQQFEQGLQGTPFEGVKALVLSDGLTLTLLDANGRVLNRPLELDA